jgi:hypothetical protein
MNRGLLFYRCNLCNRVVSPWDLNKHRGCGKCGHSKISETNLNMIEKIVQIAKHPKIWEWKNVTIGFND